MSDKSGQASGHRAHARLGRSAGSLAFGGTRGEMINVILRLTLGGGRDPGGIGYREAQDGRTALGEAAAGT